MRERTTKSYLLLFALSALSASCGYDWDNPCDQKGSAFSAELCSGCTDECSEEGIKQCSGSGYQTCTKKDADSCLRWSSEVTACGAGERCRGGQCVIPGCPGDDYIDMGTFWIGKYEASRPDATVSSAGSDSSTACSKPGVLPWISVVWNEAQAACQEAGGRLCHAGEWGDACDGVVGSGGSTYPYGNTYQASTCNSFEAEKGGIVPTGSMPGCVSGLGAYDMSGNIWEWTDDTNDEFRVVRGGSFIDILPTFFKCSTNTTSADPTSPGIGPRLGFRCCRDK